MTRTGHKREHGLWIWRDVVVAWTVAMMLVGALVLTVPNHAGERSMPAGLWSLARAAGHTHASARDAEGPKSDEACSERDYANERC
jgi:hypothetical protein